ncbi:rRNA biogenesis protein rrp5 [Psilocybe cubensis]|uniref:rRNA biogenesis protein rrp5 n=2 Tax=Psilocybe cubensis TaxID=181762 RepID=A0ACB8HFY3_PSICU|nr:rRNA biogenesis protein rrp5 [Psilocybe cubensis]KAH9486567.1 rRNA biogenesis protein rrp5 [Psilocybe cubensis]
MAALKRTLDDSTSSRKPKKSRTESHQTKASSSQTSKTSSLLSTEVDFPRGGGTSFTPLEVKAIRAEAVKEANAELFQDVSNEKKSKKKKRKTDVESSKAQPSESKDKIRIEHLNYKRLNVGMKIFGQVVSILPLALIISLPNQLFAHVPITNISSQYTQNLERAEEEEDSIMDDEEDEENLKNGIPELFELFRVGQYVRAVVSAVHQPGASDTSGIGKARDDATKASKRIELSLIPESVNAGVSKSDLKEGFTITAAVKSSEDHGYILDLGIADVSGFLPQKEADKGRLNDAKLPVGSILNVSVTKMSSNGRTCTVSTDASIFTSSCLSEISSVTSVLPGTLVQALITSVHPHGLNLQVLGFFDGTIDRLHLDEEPDSYKVGKKVKARILYEYSSSSPPKFALALVDHIVKLRARMGVGKNEAESGNSIQELYPVGTLLDAVKVVRLETERGLIAEIAPGIEGFAHISHISDDHVPSLSPSGSWKPGSFHPARVTGFFSFDGLLQLSLKPSIIQQKYFQVGDVEVGEVVKGTIKKLTDTGLFVSLSGGVDGVIWPNHYADIVLKHPAKRFKEGASIKCRVLVVDPERKRISLTAKKTLVDSNLPVLSRIEDIVPGVVTHAVVFRIYEKHLLIEFFNNLKAIVPSKEISDTPKSQLSEAFPPGRVVRVRILGVDEGRVTASIRQANSNFEVVTDISAIEIGNTVEGTVAEIHKDNAVLTLQPSRVKALLSLKNLANHRGLSVPQLRLSLKVGEKLDELVVVTRNPEKAFVLVANKPKTKGVSLSKGSAVTMENVSIGQLVGGRITRHTRHGALVKVSSNIGGILHLTDLEDDFGGGITLPAIDSIIKAVVVAIDTSKRQLTLSTRHSRMYPDQVHNVVDREISSISDIQVGDSVRGFVKNIADHGLFVTIGREVDGRVQIRELFDEYIKDWQSKFKEYQLVKGRIISLDPVGKKVEMSFRSIEASQRKTSSGVTLSDLKEGQKVSGLVKKIEDYGLFIQINDSKLSGLCHKSQLSDNADADVAGALRGFREGDKVKAYILSIDNRRISLSLKPSYFSKEDLDEDTDPEDEDAEENEDQDMEGQSVIDEHSDQDMDQDQSGLQETGSTSQTGSDDDDDDDMQINLEQMKIEYQSKKASESSNSNNAPSSRVPTLSLTGGFKWTGDGQLQEEAEESSDEDDADVGQSSKKKRKRKQIELDLTADMHTKAPESNADFERVLLGSPNSSFLWIQYMSFQLPLSEIDKAREIARRAIQTINFREEKERLNVWIALLNLENVYGTDETLDAVFKEAARANDSKTIHLRLASIFEQSDKFEKAEEQYKRTCKKFGGSSKVWTLFGEFQLKRGNTEEGRKLLPRSLQSLEKRKHLKTISKFAQVEYKYGEPERGKTLFEGIVDSHPKRWDMWSIYMDMESVQGDIQSLRNLFDRVLSLKMTSHKAKSFFKKWLEVEKRIGDEEGVTIVKQKATEWAQRALNGS